MGLMLIFVYGPLFWSQAIEIACYVCKSWNWMCSTGVVILLFSSVYKFQAFDLVTSTVLEWQEMTTSVWLFPPVCIPLLAYFLWCLGIVVTAIEYWFTLLLYFYFFFFFSFFFFLNIFVMWFWILYDRLFFRLLIAWKSRDCWISHARLLQTC